MKTRFCNKVIQIIKKISVICVICGPSSSPFQQGFGEVSGKLPGLISPRVWLSAVVFILILLFSVIVYYHSRPNPEATASLLPAVTNGDLEEVKILIKERADVNIRNESDSTPPLLALRGRQLEMARLFIRKPG